MSYVASLPEYSGHVRPIREAEASVHTPTVDDASLNNERVRIYEYMNRLSISLLALSPWFRKATFSLFCLLPQHAKTSSNAFPRTISQPDWPSQSTSHRFPVPFFTKCIILMPLLTLVAIAGRWWKRIPGLVSMFTYGNAESLRLLMIICSDPPDTWQQ